MDTRKMTHNKGLTSLESSIFDFIIKDIGYAHSIGVRGIASENFTSGATVIRLSKKMGYNGFTEMIYGLKQASEPQTKQEFTGELYQPLSALLNRNKIEDLIAVSKVLSELDDSIFINATGFSGIVGQYFYKKLLVKGSNVVIMNSGDSIGVFEKRLKRIKCYLAISKSGATPDILEKAQKAKEAGVLIVSFTSSATNQLGSLSDHTIVISEGELIDDRNLKKNFFFSECILAFEYILSL